jgi:malonate decarboxylase beta subunit
MKSFFEATARQRIQYLLDFGSFNEFASPSELTLSPHLEQLEVPQSFDDGVVIGSGLITDKPIFIAAQESGFMGGAVGEIHGAKILGLLKRAEIEKPMAVVLLLDTGGVRLHEANAGLIGVSEIMRAVFVIQKHHIPVIAVIGGSNGCFGGMSIVASCADVIIMSEEGRLSVSGPEVIETAHGVEEYDAKDRALIWRTTGGKHRYILGDCHYLVEDNFDAFRQAILNAIHSYREITSSLAALEAEHQLLEERFRHFSTFKLRSQRRYR